MSRIAVLDKDQLATSKPRGFGPHVLVLACIADDKVRAHLKLPAAACKTQVRGALATSGADPQLQTVLLVRNLETVLDAACHVLGRRPGSSKPSPLQRDGILLNLAYQGTPGQRLELLRRVPSFEYFANKLERALQDLGL